MGGFPLQNNPKDNGSSFLREFWKTTTHFMDDYRYQMSEEIFEGLTTKTGIKVRWLETLLWSRSREGCENETGLRHPILENSICQPSSKWIPFLSQGRIRQPKERDGPFICCAQNTVGL